MNAATSTERNVPAAWIRGSLLLGVLTLAISAVGGWFSPESFFRVYLAAYLFVLGFALGSMALVMAYHLTGGSWGLLIRRILEAAMKTLPLLAVLFVPIGAGVKYLYPWAQPELVAQSHKLQYQQIFLRPDYFWIRAGVYFAVWIALAYILSHWSRREDETGNPRLAWRSLKFSGAGAVIFGISVHFASIEWGMALEPLFHSSIWGPLVVSGWLLSAMCLALIVLAYYIKRPPLDAVASDKARVDLASLLFTLLILWAYMAWFQFMLIWLSNLPVDIVWYLRRISPVWKAAIWVIAALHFAVPFFLLLMRPIKRNSRVVAGIAVLILIMQLAFDYYQIVPGVSLSVANFAWMSVLVPVGLAGVWLACFFWLLNRRTLLPPHDYNRAAALHLRHLDEDEAAREEALSHG